MRSVDEEDWREERVRELLEERERLRTELAYLSLDPFVLGLLEGLRPFGLITGVGLLFGVMVGRDSVVPALVRCSFEAGFRTTRVVEAVRARMPGGR